MASEHAIEGFTSPEDQQAPTVTEPTKVVFDLPEHLTRTYDEGEDVTAPKTKRGRIVNQSFISMIASVGLSSNFNGDFGNIIPQTSGEGRGSADQNTSHGLDPDRTTFQDDPTLRNSISEQRMLQSSPGLYKKPTRKKHQPSLADPMTTSQILMPPKQPQHSQLKATDRPRRLYGEQIPSLEKDIQASNSPVEEDQILAAGDATEDRIAPASSEPSLAERIASMFGLANEEEVKAECPCCLLQEVPVQGYLYVLEKHICFYAYLPKETSFTSKSGYLYKRGSQNPKYNRYWFNLKGNVLYYYTNRDEQYFPRGTIALHSGVSAQQKPTKEGDHVAISITSEKTTYRLKAENASGAKDWVEKILRATFRSSHNIGESIKISLPVDNILDMEESPMTEGTQMVKIKVIDNDETFAVDEYFFSLSHSTPEELQPLRDILQSDQKPKTVDNQGMMMEDIPLDQPSSAQEALARASLSNSTKTLTAESGNISQSPLSPRRQHKSDEASSSSSLVNSASMSALRSSDSLSAMQDFYKAGTDRLRQATLIAGSLSSHSRRVGNMLARESKGYYERVYSMWAGKKAHYDDKEGILYEPTTDHEAERDRDSAGDRFRKHFALPPSEKLQASYYSYLHRVVPVYGKVYVGSSKVCFRSLMPGTRTKMILPFRDIENVTQEKGFRFGHSGLVVVIRGHEEIFFEFRDSVGRDDCAITLLQILDSVKQIQDSRMLSREEQLNVEAAKAEHDLLQKARHEQRDVDRPAASSDASDNDISSEAAIFDDNLASIVDFKPPGPLNITCLTIGSRGDVQPYIALCKGLLAEGHRPTIATHAEFEPWIRSHGIEFKLVAGNPAKIMQLCVENDMFTVAFLREAQKFRGFISELLESSWVACQDADILIESPSAMGGIHIAEALEIPYFRAFTMPWTRTRAYPHAFAVMNQKMGGNWNWYSYVLFDVGFWQGIAKQINGWRVKTLDLPPTSLGKLQTDKVPFMYNFSPSVVAPPLDFSHQVHITGYWFLDEGEEYQPPAKMMEFIQHAKQDGKKLVYVGFGSVTVEDPVALTRAVSEAVRDADVRCILCKGWSDRLDKRDASVPEIPLHDSIFQIPGAPHDWLFRQVDAAVHHGGAGTTGASLRAGIPTIVKPFFGDQHFFASRVEDLGVGRCLKNINSRSLARALVEATHSERMISRAKALGERIRCETGVANAIQTIYRDLEYARSLIKRKALGETEETYEGTVETEESWTLVEDDQAFYEGSQEGRKKQGPNEPEFEASLGRIARRSGVLDEDSAASARSSEDSASSGGDDYDDNDATAQIVAAS